MDTSDKTPGWKFSEQEMLGIPARIEIGPKDIENNTVVIVRRDTREKSQSQLTLFKQNCQRFLKRFKQICIIKLKNS